ncbi:ATP-dependent Clp protease ATP-binding subunit [Mesomycoplasma lagogenitalium]|uniref:AAA family ATPase n=1 Tax=Mesomycoplasma lagogenitalium TaxID=171286 RepID=A0ABY8LUJ1_9BACT|nr:AAA family ATPase [Mesomycoplasma lagogenitalium]WGI36908.1 AAA family ATPase [Mesomycoplasma lagogenitalium]
MNFTEQENNKNPLEQFGKNLTELAKSNKLDPVINRDDEIRRIITILSRKTKNNPVLVGEPGVGKTAIIEGLARKIIEGQVPEDLKNKEIWEIDLSSIVAGASYHGQFEDRLKKILKKIEESNGNIIVFIDEIHLLIGAGKTSDAPMDAANIIKPMMARGQIKLIGATTLEEYKLYIEKDAALERRMQKIDVNEPNIEDSITILRGIKDRLETFHNVKIEDDALISAVKLSSRYITDRFLPDKAIDLIDEASANIKVEMNYQPEIIGKLKQEFAKLEMEKFSLAKDKKPENKEKIDKLNEQIAKTKQEINKYKELFEQEKNNISLHSKYKNDLDNLNNKFKIYQSEGKFKEASEILYNQIPMLETKIKEIEKQEKASLFLKDTVSEEDIAKIVAKWTKIPVDKLIEKEKNKILDLAKNLKSRIKGQDNAIDLVYKSILRSKANINDPNKPIGSFIFAGSTGVGKTELARAVAYYLFDSEKQIIRLDMSEYMEKHSVSKLIGSPPGYIGYEQGGQLTEKVRQNPYSIILFDEIEKAHYDVVNILLQILDNGFLTDSKGRKINFRNTIIIMTTNIGSKDILENPNINQEEIKEKLLEFFKPEFINRVDEIIKFEPLNDQILAKITELELNKLAERLKNSLNINLTFESDVIEYVVKNTDSINYGARPIKHFIKRNIETYLANEIVSQTINKNDNISVFIEKNQVKHSKKA